ncbi:hypothetical protein RND71_002348 [Anisodus tanguticus]|uniref:Uncharacterized protein n=1 Tax=Anisodus tanguticus TaxID=243964 RepID=A0AAE1VWH9_9SOLA|nr:hypothetical protein RND71_002348 [Anisodus tanguticus]
MRRKRFYKGSTTLLLSYITGNYSQGFKRVALQGDEHTCSQFFGPHIRPRPVTGLLIADKAGEGLDWTDATPNRTKGTSYLMGRNLRLRGPIRGVSLYYSPTATSHYISPGTTTVATNYEIGSQGKRASMQLGERRRNNHRYTGARKIVLKKSPQPLEMRPFLEFCVNVEYYVYRAQVGNTCAASFDWSCCGICKSVERTEDVHQRWGEGYGQGDIYIVLEYEENGNCTVLQ